MLKKGGPAPLVVVAAAYDQKPFAVDLCLAHKVVRRRSVHESPFRRLVLQHISTLADWQVAY